ncbi:hypothetical protein Q7P37_006097 [Cladosporium fusiforme]
MFTSNFMALGAFFVSTAMASPILVARQRGDSPCFRFDDNVCPAATYCDSTLTPTNFAECESLLSTIYGIDGDISVSANGCRYWTGGNSDCRVGICNNENYEITYSANQVAGWAEQGMEECRPGAGVSIVPDVEPFLDVYVTTPLPQQTRLLAGGEIVEATCSVDEYKAMLDETAKIQGGKSAFEKRQASDDEDFTVTTFNFGTTRSGGSEIVSDILPDGSSFSTSEAETFTFGVTASVELGGSLFSTMTASAGISVDTSESYTNTLQTTVTIDCDGSCGLVEYFHLYDCYEGNFQPSGQAGEFCVPIDSGRYSQRCVGC